MVSATEESANDFVLEEIVVTSRKRAESLQDVPATVQAFSESMIEDAAIERASDFLNLTPNVMMLDIQDAGSAFLTIRGITSNRNTEQSVAVVYDGVLTTSPTALTQELFDIQQIEVLKGPQGALYGRNAIGGAILVTSKEASNEAEGKVSIGSGSGDRSKISAAYSGSLIEDKLFFRIAGNFTDSDGRIKNRVLNGYVDPYKDSSGRIKLRWDVSDAMSMDLRYNQARTEGGAFNFDVSSSFFRPNFNIGNEAGLGPDCGAAPRTCDLIGDANITVEDLKADNNVKGKSVKDLAVASFKLDWDLGWAELTAVTAWDEVDVNSYGDSAVLGLTAFNGLPDGQLDTPYGPGRGFTQAAIESSQAISQEIKLTSPAEDSLRWIAGAYYVSNQRDKSIINGIDTDDIVIRAPSAFPFGGREVNPSSGYVRDKTDIEAWALFGQLAYDLSDTLELSFALRYDEDVREITSLTPTAFIPAQATGQFFGQKQEETFDKLQPKLNLRWQPSEELTVYGSWGTGFRAGGFNQTGIASAVAADHASFDYQRQIQIPENITDVFKQEETKDIELGFKSVLLDGSLRLNGAIFNTEVKNKQFFIFVSTQSINAQTLLNIDEVTMSGVELDFLWRTPLEGLDVFGAYGRIKSEIDKYTANEDFPTKGNHAPYVPVYTSNFGFQYTTPIYIEGVNAITRLDYQRLGRTYWSPEEFSSRDPVNLVNASLALETEDGTWRLAAWVKNLTNEIYNAEYDGPGGFVHPGSHRTSGIDLTYRF
ncbi:TonB-dependent receptor [Pseudomaricurvus alkylphenolicus]|uniref:TonB-dependent receptor n=1 Tax=Pseudomaricurvus alkylphenolicus TaxID=1306991 RepID=UPI001421DA31|nr:TonB-dependent receptor [Pseudomaricurvus alkylphenolicus]NIB40822.1 TonB-dependent receptor [Pseudomaricurvus alkylphenolicus]